MSYEKTKLWREANRKRYNDYQKVLMRERRKARKVGGVEKVKEAKRPTFI